MHSEDIIFTVFSATVGFIIGTGLLIFFRTKVSKGYARFKGYGLTLWFYGSPIAILSTKIEHPYRNFYFDFSVIIIIIIFSVWLAIFKEETYDKYIKKYFEKLD